VHEAAVEIKIDSGSGRYQDALVLTSADEVYMRPMAGADIGVRAVNAVSGARPARHAKPSGTGGWRASLRKRDIAVIVALVAWSGAMCVLAVLRGVRHDYVQYLRQWSLVRNGEDPWSGSNTYGPVHNLLAFLAEPSRLGPKLFLVVAFLAVNFLLLCALLRTRPTASPLLAYAAIVPLNFAVISVVASFGLNDALVAAFLGLAVLARFRGRLLLAGAFVGLAILLKYYPALLVPFLCLDGRRLNLKPLLAAIATTAVGIALSFVVWGDGVVASLTMGVSREPKLLSVLYALEQHPELGGRSAVVDFLVRANTIFVLLGVALCVVLVFWLRLSWIEGAAIGTLVYLLIYKVGHPQFFIPWLFLLVGLLILGTARSRYLAYCCLPYVLFISVFQVGYEVLTDGYREIGAGVRANVGFVAFTLGVATIVFFLATMSRPARPATGLTDLRSARRPRPLRRPSPPGRIRGERA
jgi:hypothetical protein